MSDKTITSAEDISSDNNLTETDAEETAAYDTEASKTGEGIPEVTDTAPAEVISGQETAPGSEEPGGKIKKIRFSERIDMAEAAVAAFIKDNNIMARFIGLFMIFSSVMYIYNYRREDRIKNFLVSFGDSTDVSGWQHYSNSVSFTKMGAFILVLFAAVSLLKHFIPKLKKINIDGYILILGVMSFGICALWRNDSNTFYSVYAFGITAVSAVILACFLRTDEFGEMQKISGRLLFVILLILASGVGVYVAATTICKHRVFHTAVFDLGIFAQMYHSMITDFTQNTTCERGYLLSHFAVHFSPIYYVLVPVYYFFPSAETLLASQAVLAVSGFIPVWLICRKYNFSNILSFLFTLVYIFSVSVISPCYYEFHENAFLPPLLMWFFYAIEKNSKPMMYIFMVLVLMVKEDAALFVLCISLYTAFSGKNKKHGTIMFFITAAVFVNVLALMGKYGEGAMTSRTFGNLMQNYDGGFGEVAKTALTNPMYFIQQCFANDKLEKFVFIIVMLFPLLFMPFITKKPSRLLLVVPFLAMNLASGYPYAYKFDFQYVFGTSACLIYAALINVADLDKKAVRTVIPLMAVASVFMFTANVTNKLYYIDIYRNYRESNDLKDSYCQSIPEDASLLTTSFLIPHCTNRDELYILDEGSSVNDDTCDFVMFEDGNDEWKENKRRMLEEEGYRIWAEEKGLVVIYVSPEYRLNN